SVAPCSSSPRKPAAGRSAIRAAPTSSSVGARPSPACPTAPTTRASPTSPPTCAATGVPSAAERRRRAAAGRRAGRSRTIARRSSVAAGAGRTALLRRLAEAVVERIAGAAHGADRIGVVAAIESLAQPADVDIDGALVDVNLAAPHAVEQLLAGEHASRTLHQELEQPIFGGAEVDCAAAARDPLLLAVDLEVAEGQHVGQP